MGKLIKVTMAAAGVLLISYGIFKAVFLILAEKKDYFEAPL